MRVLVTGAGGGLGLGAARALLEQGHEVVAHVREAARAPGGDWSGVIAGDLSQLDQVRAIADDANARFGRFDAVIHNAGVLDSPHVLAVNVVAPFALTALMQKPGRLVYLSSGMHRGGSTDLRRLERVSYSDSKLHVTALAMAVAHRWDGTVSHAVDPGWVPTRMGGRHAPDDLVAGHETQVWLATHDVTPPTGGYWYHRQSRQPHPAALDTAFQNALIAALEARTGVPLG